MIVHYSAILRLFDRDVALAETPPARRPATTSEILKEFYVPLVNGVDSIFQVEYRVTGLHYRAHLIEAEREATGLPLQKPPTSFRSVQSREIPFLRTTHRFEFGGHTYDVRLLSMRE